MAESLAPFEGPIKWEKLKRELKIALEAAQKQRRYIKRQLDIFKTSNEISLEEMSPEAKRAVAEVVFQSEQFYYLLRNSFVDHFANKAAFGLTSPDASTARYAKEDLVERVSALNRLDNDEDGADDEYAIFFAKSNMLLDFIDDDIILCTQALITENKAYSQLPGTELTNVQNIVVGLNRAFQSARLLFEVITVFFKRYYTIH